MKKLVPYALSCMVSVAVSVLLTLNFMPMPLVSVDLPQLIAHQSRSLATLPERAQAAEQEKVARRIDRALALYSKTTGKGILVSNAVVKGMPDITPDIDALLSAQ